MMGVYRTLTTTAVDAGRAQLPSPDAISAIVYVTDCRGNTHRQSRPSPYPLTDGNALTPCMCKMLFAASTLIAPFRRQCSLAVVYNRRSLCRHPHVQVRANLRYMSWATSQDPETLFNVGKTCNKISSVINRREYQPSPTGYAITCRCARSVPQSAAPLFISRHVRFGQCVLQRNGRLVESTRRIARWSAGQ